MERVDFAGDSPQARFGHTITPIAKDKAILFGGAVGDTGTPHPTQANTSSLATPSSATILFVDGGNSTAMAHLPPTVLPTQPSPSITFSSYLEEHLAAGSSLTMLFTSWTS